MDERNNSVELPSSIEKIKKNEEFHCRQDISDVSMPICFLVKEQAKSQVAIEDLKKRVKTIENIQDDIIDSLAHIKKVLYNDSKTLSSANLTHSPLVSSNQSSSLCTPGYDSLPQAKYPYSPPMLNEGTLTPPKNCGINRSRSTVHTSSKKCSESRGKEVEFENDKQDSGLDSDCRDNPSLNKQSVIWTKQESGDELLQLLDEISQKTEFLQNQLTVVSQSPHAEVQSTLLHAPTEKPKLSKVKSNLKVSASHVASNSCFSQMVSSECSPTCGHFENKSFSKCIHKEEKRINKIDSALVSSVLKETNIIDLQRQILIYLVENAVLQTKLSEMEHLLHSKVSENSKMESNLKDETRLLMMENRELRISLDQQKLQTNSLKSKIIMLERVLQSISSENHDLSLHLSQSLNAQNLPLKDSRKLSSSFTFGNAATSKGFRRSSLPTQFSCQSDMNINCVKPKLLSNVSNYLDITSEEPELREQWLTDETPGYNLPVQSSTPILNTTKLRDVKAGIASSNFQTTKNFNQTKKDDASYKNYFSEKCVPDSTHNSSEACAANKKHNPDDLSAKFPFNSILEKLKANSDYRLSRRTLTQTADVNIPGNYIKSVKKNSMSEQGEEIGARPNSQNKAFQCKKGKNIHQRIQDILDRIMSESEEIA